MKLPISDSIPCTTEDASPLPLWKLFENRVFICRYYATIKAVAETLSVKNNPKERIKPEIIVPSYAAFSKWNISGMGQYSNVGTDCLGSQFSLDRIRYLIQDPSIDIGISLCDIYHTHNLQELMAYNIIYLFEMLSMMAYPEIWSNQPIFMISMTYPENPYDDIEKIYYGNSMRPDTAMHLLSRPVGYEGWSDRTHIGNLYDPTYPVQLVAEFIQFVRANRDSITPNAVGVSDIVKFIEETPLIRTLATYADMSLLRKHIGFLIQKNSFNFKNDIVEWRPEENFETYDI